MRALSPPVHRRTIPGAQDHRRDPQSAPGSREEQIVIFVVFGTVLLCASSIAAGFAVRAWLTRTASADEPAGPAACALSADAARGWWSLARAALRPDRRIVSSVVWLMLLDAALALAAPWPVTIVIDQVFGHRRSPAPLAPLRHLGPLWATASVAAAGLVLLAAGAVVGYLVGYLTTSLAERTAARLRQATVAHLLHVPASSTSGYATGDLANRVTGDTARVSDTLVSAVETLVPEAALLGGMTLITGLLDWRLMLTALAVIPLFALTARIRNRSVEPAARVSRTRAGELASLTTELLSRLPAVHVFGQIRTELRAFGRVSNRSARASIDAVDAGARFTPVTDTLPGLALAAALVAGGLEVQSGRLSLGGLVLFLAYLSSLTAPVHALAGLSGALARGVASRNRLRELLAITPIMSVTTGAPEFPARTPTAAARVDVDDVRAPRPGAVAAGVSFHVDPGEFVCLTGPSGTGKTTVLSLLCRLLEPSAGQIRVGGRDLAAIPLAELRRLVTLVPQDPWLHSGTVADNIRYGRPDAARAEIRAAAERAGAAEFITRLPDGYDTPIGEHGRRLSGGQQRRIALARALLCDTPILLLDEPTTGLDRRAQAELVATLRSVTDRTVIAATHHDQLARAADRIIDLGPRGERSRDEWCDSRSVARYTAPLTA
jgi:ABC-type multidrug transport system fused ATPase/permease subunit